MIDERGESGRGPFEGIDAHVDQVSAGLRRAIGILREDVTVRPAWRDALMAAIHADDGASDANGNSHTSARPWPSGRGPLASGWRAAAAAVLLVSVGALGGSLATRYRLSKQHDARALAPASVSSTDADRVSVRFTIVAPTARHVALVGDFNGWSASQTPLVRQRDAATWVATVALPRGRHAYSFVIDGEVVSDPAAPLSADDDFGVPNSVVLVSTAR